MPLILRRGPASSAAPKRPQEPRPPFPYAEEEVVFTNPAAKLRLAGTLTLPPGKGPFPAVVLLTGSGPQDRDGTVVGHHPFKVIADYLTRRDIVVLRFDDRGVGRSEGSLLGTSAADYAGDALAAIAFLRTQPLINPGQIVLAGHSEGGTAAVLASGQSKGPDFLILLATPGLKGTEVIAQQVANLVRLQTSDPAQVAAVEAAQRGLLKIIQQNPDNAQAQAKLMAEISRLNPALNTEAVRRQAALMTSPEYRHILANDPAMTLKSVGCPVLALNGSKDLQVAAGPNLRAIDSISRKKGNKDVTVRELPGLNHLFQTAPTGSPAEYGQLEESFAPIALQALGDWIVQRTTR